MKAYIWSRRSKVYHEVSFMTERCNTDGMKDREESDTPPTGRNYCAHCQMQRAWEHKRAAVVAP